MSKSIDPVSSSTARRTIGRRALVWCAVSAVLATALIVGGLVWWIESSAVPVDKRLPAVLDAVKIGLSVGAGLGGIFALYLGWRRQHAVEVDQERQERVAAVSEADSLSRRITELYTKAMELVGSDEAAVRLGGLYALERLAQDNQDQRQTVMNVLCAYLRMPYTVVDSPAPAADEHVRSDYRRNVEEREVRITAQRIITSHLEPGSNPVDSAATFWAAIHLDLNGATLINLQLDHCHVHTAAFSGATFYGDASFREAQFGGNVLFRGTRFGGSVVFRGARFGGHASFPGAQFSESTWFDRAQFDGYASFRSARFDGYVSFPGAWFAGNAWFDGAHFGGYAWFDGAHFGENASFDDTRFGGYTSFRDTTFAAGALLDTATFVRGTPVAMRPFLTSAEEVTV